MKPAGVKPGFMLAADEVIELGRPGADLALPLGAVRGVFDAWISQLSKRLTDLIALEDRLSQNPAGAFKTWAGKVTTWPAMLELTSLGEQWEIVRRTAYSLLGQAQAIERRFGPYLSTEEDQLLSMQMDRALDAVARAKRVAQGLRKGLRQAADGVVHAVSKDLGESLTDLARIVGQPAQRAQTAFAAEVVPSPGVVGWVSDHWLGVLLGTAATVTAIAVLPPLIRSQR